MTSDTGRRLLRWVVWNLRGRPRVDLLDYVQKSIVKGLGQREMAICPTHGPVRAEAWRGALVCPDPECHRTCSAARAV